jgi:hypothetical protein
MSNSEGPFTAAFSRQDRVYIGTTSKWDVVDVVRGF